MLGPIGSVNLHTHKLPVNLKMNLVLNRDITTGQDVPGTVKTKYNSFKFDAVNAFLVFLGTRLALIALIGAFAGVSISNGGERWRKKMFRNAAIGFFCVLVLAGGVAGNTYHKLDRKPHITYKGEIAKDLSKVFPLIEKIAGGYRLKKNLLHSYIEGAVMLNSQMNGLAVGNDAKTGTRILVASDIHDNIAGMQLASQILNDKTNPNGAVSALILAGDITNWGYKSEAQFYGGILNTSKTPVYFIGGNHENASAMKMFETMGYKLLNGQEIFIDSVSVIGQSDPTAYTASLVATPQQLKDSSEALAEEWRLSIDPPGVVVVHNLAQAQDVINLAKADKRYVIVIYGHDHIVGHKVDGTVSEIDCGTGGASGLDGISKETDYTFQILDFSSDPSPRLTGIYTLVFHGLNDGNSVDYYPINQGE